LKGENQNTHHGGTETRRKAKAIAYRGSTRMVADQKSYDEEIRTAEGGCSTRARFIGHVDWGQLLDSRQEGASSKKGFI